VFTMAVHLNLLGGMICLVQSANLVVEGAEGMRMC
jgi:hypothetical protein